MGPSLENLQDDRQNADVSDSGASGGYPGTAPQSHGR